MDDTKSSRRPSVRVNLRGEGPVNRRIPCLLAAYRIPERSSAKPRTPSGFSFPSETR